MGRVLTNNTSLAVAVESSIGVLPGSPVWYLLEPNAITNFGATVTNTERSPISKDRQRRKGTTTDLDSAAEYEQDLTMDVVQLFTEAFVYALAANPTIIRRLKAGAAFHTLAADDALAGVAGTPPGFSHSALSAAIPANTLVYSRGFTNPVNNGLFLVGASGTTTETPVTGSPAFVDETPAQVTGASLEVAGRRIADLTWTDATNAIGSSGTDLSLLGLSPGQFIQVGNSATTQEFTNGSVRGRIVSIAAGSIVLDKVVNIESGTLDGGGNQASTSVELLYGQFVRNVPVDDSSFLERYFQFEAAYENLQVPGPGDEYEYAIGNKPNTMVTELPLADKAKLTFGFIGQDTEVPTSTRKTGAAAPIQPLQTSSFNTSSDLARLRITEVDETGITTCFKSATLTLDNGASPEKCLGTLGALFINNGNFLVSLEAQIVFTDSRVISAVRQNRTVTFDTIIKNDDGAVAIDIPSMTLGGGAKEYPVNESVLVNLTGEAFRDTTLGTSIGVSMFPYLP